MLTTYRICTTALAVLAAAHATLGVADQPRADLSRIVVIGDSLMAGYQNNSLWGPQQQHSMGAKIATQAGSPLAQPLIADPGIPSVLSLVQVGPPLVVQPLAGTSSGRVDMMTQVTNLAVPGHSVRDALERRPDLPIDSMTDLVLGLPGLLGGVAKSQVEWVEALQPTTIVCWIGANDALGVALDGNLAELTPVEQFAADYAELMRRLAATRAAIVVGNVPDVTVIPYLTAAEKVAANVGYPLAMVGPLLGLKTGDYVTPSAFPIIAAILGGFATGPLPGDVVLDAEEVATVKAATAGYNRIIAQQAAQHGAAVADMHHLLNDWHQQGLVVNGQRLNTEFLGGLFSLDGFHPTTTAYAAAANVFIRALNRQFAAEIPVINIGQVAKADPLVLGGVARPPRARHVAAETASSLRAALKQ